MTDRPAETPERAVDYESHTRRHYQDDATARRYAARQRLTRSPVEWLIGRLEIRRVTAGLDELDGGASVLDVPAGSGNLTPLLTSRFRTVVAADISGPMLEHIRESLPKCRADVTALPFRPAAVDVVVMLRLLHRVPREVAEAAVGEGLRVGGRGLVFSYTGTPRSSALYRAAQVLGRRPQVWTTQMSTEEMRRLVERSGGRVLSDRSISGGLTTERVLTCVPAAARDAPTPP